MLNSTHNGFPVVELEDEVISRLRANSSELARDEPRPSLTLGIETTGGLMGEIIPRNTVIPTSRSKVYTTAEDNQAAVMNKVFEGERKLTKDNRLLGSFELTGIPPMPKGKAQIEVRLGRVSDTTHAPPQISPRSSRHR